MKILVLAPYLPTLPIASGCLRAAEFCRHLSRQHELHLVCWHRTQLDNKLVKAFWESEMGWESNPALYPELEKYREVLGKYEGVFSTISTLPYSDIDRQSLWHRMRWWLSMSPRRLLQYRAPEAYQEMRMLVQRRLEETKTDLIWVRPFPMAEFAFGSRVPVVVDSPDAHSLRELRRSQLETSKLASLERRLNAFRWRRFERKALACCAAFVLNNESDARYLVTTGLPAIRIHTIPNGVDTEYFVTRSDIDEEPDLLVFIGSFRYHFNLDGALYFLEYTWPLIRQERPTCKLMLIGPEPPDSLKKFASDNVIVMGYVPDIRPYLQKASLCISPLRSGTGMKNKVLVALAMGKTIVCTSIDCDGINVSDGVEVAIADGPAVFAQRVLELLSTPEVRRRMGALGRQKVVREYSWKSRAEEYEQLFLSAAKIK
jgi:glycosyltransferase involved in cell wall biosynthesis